MNKRIKLLWQIICVIACAMILFNIYVREKSIYSNKILRLNENMIDYKLKLIIYKPTEEVIQQWIS